MSRVEAAGVNAVRLREDVGISDRGRSAVAGMTRVMGRIEKLCTEIATLAAVMSKESAAAVSAESAQAAQKASAPGPVRVKTD